MITTSDLLDYIAQNYTDANIPLRRPGDGITVREYYEHNHIGRDCAQRRLNKMCKDGLLEKKLMRISDEGKVYNAEVYFKK
jgi:hypothetical protein